MGKMNSLGKKIQRCYYRIKNKCYNPNDTKYLIYGGRGIKMCDEWKNNYIKFYDWAIDNGVDIDLSIDRIDNNGDYCPENCRWVDMFVQQNNKRNNINICFNKETKTLKQWADKYKISYPCVLNRYYFCKKHNIIITDDVFNNIMKPVFYYRGTEFKDLVLGIDRNNFIEQHQNKIFTKKQIYYYKNRDKILSNSRKKYKERNNEKV